jgi:NADPH-dependent 2,4-dienoyl-CoA reductase/sulfur reductase-like enzyme/peroxiredoxin family protein/rhodanese-related sulfurtransferase/TusA-related sulfurtransferase
MNVTKLLIIGGVAGGASAAARARRLDENVEIILFERGPDISFANCGLPYHIGGMIADRDKLLITTPQMMETKFNMQVRTLSEVASIDRDKKEIFVKNLATGEHYTEPYDVLILSPGAAPIRPPLPGIENPNILTLRNLQDMDRIIESLKNKTTAAVIGGGYIGLEIAEALREINIGTSLIELTSQVMSPADPEMAAVLHQELRMFGVDLRLGTSVSAFEPAGNGIDLILNNGERLHVDLAILAIGVKPETTLAVDAGLGLGSTGGIKVNEQMQTSDPSVYAVGDAVEVTDFVTGQPALIPLAGPANRQGRIAADHIFGRSSSYKNTQGTAICKVFNLAIGMTGLSEKTAVRTGTAYEKVYVHPMSHAGYYPGAKQLSLKVLFDPGSGKVLGAQAVGADGVDKHIDVIAVAIRAGLTVYDFEEMELSYAPPYGSAKDPVNYAGFVAANALRGDVQLCHVENMRNPTENQMIIDVRNPEEFQGGSIPAAENIPLGQLRSKLGDLSKDKEYLVTCQVGLRGYLACRILTQNGFECRNLTGGYKTYSITVGALPDTPKKVQPAPSICSLKTANSPGKVVKHIDASGLQCPGPIMSLKIALDEIQDGEAVTIRSTDPGFSADIPAWCNSTGHQLDQIRPVSGGGYEAIIVKRQGQTDHAMVPQETKRFTNVVFSNDLDRALASFIIANGAATMGYEVTLFFTFWGLNILRENGPLTVKKTLIEQLFGWMMPQGPDKLSLSQLHMAGMGTAMMKDVMKKKNVSTLPELIKSAQANGVKMVACTMTMDLMGIKSEELIDGIEEGGVAMYIDQIGGNANLFI